MTATATEVPEDVKTAVAEWRKAYPNGVPVLHWLGGDREDEPEIDFAIRPEAHEEPMVTLLSNYRQVPMAHVERHPLAAEVAALPKPEERGLEFPVPPCPFCQVDTYHNGDNFECEHCGAVFDSHGSGSTRHCVEDCYEEATVVGADGQPRCITCEVRVRADEDPNGPYECRRCKAQVVGIPLGKEACNKRLCPECLVGERNRAFIDEILARRSS